MRECNHKTRKERDDGRNQFSISTRGPAFPETCCWPLLLDTDREAAGLERVLRGAVAALGLDGSIVEVTPRRGVGRRLHPGRRCDDGRRAPLRHLADMEKIIGGAPVCRKGCGQRSLAAVRRLAEVEAAIHGCAVDEIHFHEVGAVDTLVDVVGTFALVEALGVERVYVGTIPVGGGTVEIAHGRMGVPAPATARLLEGYADRRRSRRRGS